MNTPPTTNLEPKAGIYKGRAVPTSVQYGESKNGTPELLVMFNAPSLNRQFTVPFYFSAAAAPHSVAKLRLCGWEGGDLSNLAGIDRNEVDLQITWEPYEGQMKMKVQVAGGGQFTTANPVDSKQWAAKVSAIMGGGGPQAAGSNNSGGPKPPF